MRRVVAMLLAAGALAGCGSSSQSSSSTQAAAKPSERDVVRAKWRRYVTKRARADARVLGAHVVKVDASVDKPTDYGLGGKQTAGTAYVEISAGGHRSATIYSADMNLEHGRVYVSNVEQQPTPTESR